MREIIYGRNPVYECLRAGRRDVFGVMIAQRAKAQGTLAEIVALADRRGASVRRVDRQQLDKLGKHINHQGVVAEVSGYPYVDFDAILTEAAERGDPPWILLLDCLQDPQNLGTLLRTAEIVGVHGVVLPARRSAGVTPAVVSASSGASEYLRVAQVTNLVRAMEALKERDVWIAGLEDVTDARELWQADLGGALGLVVGSEGQGIRRLVRETCDFCVRLPMRGQINSLNAAVAGSVALYEVARQRGMGEGRTGSAPDRGQAG
jgi:23S rRNA (guanosine2251-2'-O)-methyltransferase